MPHPRSSYRAPTRTPRRVKKWGLGPKALPASLSSSTESFWTAGVVLTTEAQVTLLRIRGMLDIFLLSATGAGDGFDGALGIGLVTNDGFAAGSTAMPDPLVDMDWDGWIWHTFFHVHPVIVTIADGVNGPAAHMRIPIDSKAMRKWSEGYTLAGKIGQVENGTATAEIWAQTRTLFALA